MQRPSSPLPCDETHLIFLPCTEGMLELWENTDGILGCEFRRHSQRLTAQQRRMSPSLRAGSLALMQTISTFGCTPENTPKCRLACWVHAEEKDCSPSVRHADKLAIVRMVLGITEDGTPRRINFQNANGSTWCDATPESGGAYAGDSYAMGEHELSELRHLVDVLQTSGFGIMFDFHPETAGDEVFLMQAIARYKVAATLAAAARSPAENARLATRQANAALAVTPKLPWRTAPVHTSHNTHDNLLQLFFFSLAKQGRLSCDEQDEEDVEAQIRIARTYTGENNYDFRQKFLSASDADSL